MSRNWLLLAALICFINIKATQTEKGQSKLSKREKSLIISTITSLPTEEIDFDYNQDSEGDEYEDDSEEYYDDDEDDQEDDINEYDNEEAEEYEQDEEEYQENDETNDDYE